MAKVLEFKKKVSEDEAIRERCRKVIKMMDEHFCDYNPHSEDIYKIIDENEPGYAVFVLSQGIIMMVEAIAATGVIEAIEEIDFLDKVTDVLFGLEKNDKQ